MNRDREALLNSIRTCLEAFDATGHCGESTSERISRERRQDCALHAMPGILRLARRELLALPPAGGVEEAVIKVLPRLSGPHEWGYRDPTDGKFVPDDTPFSVANALRSALPDRQKKAR